jgi:uncharacterized OB-fold protein
MKKFMESCYHCNGSVRKKAVIKEGIKLFCMKCLKCGEEYFTSSELTKSDTLTWRTPAKSLE